MTPPRAAEAAVLAAIDEAAILDDLRSLVAIASVDGSPAEADAQRWTAERLRALGLDVDCWDIDVAAEQAQPDFPGMEVERSTAVGCVAVLGDPDVTPALALYGHTDVVPAGDLAPYDGRDPFALVVRDGLAWGRGACDMKAGVAAALGAVAAIRRAGVPLSRPLALHAVSAEEDGGLGAVATLRRGHTAEACISAEPTGGTMIPANAGALTFRLEIEGLATHGSTRGHGVSAIEKFELVHAALRALDQRRNHQSAPYFEHLDLPWPLSVGTVSAGDWASTVPDRLVATGRYGVRIDETVAEAVEALESVVADVCADDPWLHVHPAGVSWPGGMFAPGSLPAGHGLLDQVADAVAAVRGTRPVARGGPYGSDLRHYTRHGVATVQYGPGQVEVAHAVGEHVELAEIYACARIYALLAVRLCS